MSETAVHPRTRAEDLLLEIQSNLLECKVCLESFSTQTRDQTPRNLPCGHVLCLKCIRALSDPVKKRPECPFCRKPWDAGSTSECRALVDLQDLLRFGASGWTESRATPRLRSAFGGWGTVVNPCGMAISQTSGRIALVHDGEERVVFFDARGARMDAFGRYGHNPTDVCHPLDVALTKSGHVLVTDAGDRSVKAFSCQGRPLAIIRDGLGLPWGVDVDEDGRVFVSDADMGTLRQLVMDFSRGLVLVNRVVVKDLTRPRSLACCRASGSVAVVEHLQSSFTLRIFSRDFVALTQVDGFGLGLRSSVSLSVTAVLFDRSGGMMVADVRNGMVWRLGTPQETPALTPLVSGLMRPVALAATPANELVVLDAGDHAVKIYAVDIEDDEDLYCDKTTC